MKGAPRPPPRPRAHLPSAGTEHVRPCPSRQGPAPAACPTGRRKQDKAGKDEEGILTLGRSRVVDQGPWTAWDENILGS